jgi:hypothetical protein
MNPELRERFERLLRELPEWEREEDRRVLLRGILRFHSVSDFLNLKGSVAIVAHALIDTCLEQDPESLCVLLMGLREKYKTWPERAAEIDFLESSLCGGDTLHRGQWRGAPYLGLAYFDRQHAPIFFGREMVLRQLVQTLNKQQGRRFTVILGASGSGKSSLVRAGLWARLTNGGIAEMPDSELWLISAMTPTDADHPMAAFRASVLKALQEHDSFRSQCDWRKELGRMKDSAISALEERLLSKALPEACWLVILDQMEELFAAEMKETGAAFLDQIIEATQPPSRLRVVATLRADFFHHCLDHPPLRRLMGRDGGVFPLGQPDRRSLQQMVSGPLTRVDLIPEHSNQKAPAMPWFLDPDLPPVIAADAERHPGGLALMAFALRELYDTCESTRRMDLATYSNAAFGGLGGAIARRADATLQLLGKDGEIALDRVFVRLVRVNRDDAPVRRRERLSAWEGDPGALNVIQSFQEARLLVADRGDGDDTMIEVAHEALLREWPKLGHWIQERREAFQLAERVRTEAHAWMQGDKKRHNLRPWPTDLIEDYRQNLKLAGLLGSLLEDPAVARLLMTEAEWILAEVALEETTNLRRWEIGRRLAEIGDPRPGVGVIDGVPDIVWRPIPGGSVEIAERGKFHVEPFRMAAFPVTVIQFHAFLDAKDGYKSQRWWQDLTQKDLKREEREPAWESPLLNHPVTNVSWFDATAFCRWLSAKLGLYVRMPDEQEWQWVAQSGKGYAYPWGPEWLDRRANTTESGIYHTTAVGMFPHGESPWKVSDLAGNVWEWCGQVLRGGSWGDNRSGSRADVRGYYHPGNRSNYNGFRVAVSSPIGEAGH